MKTTVYIVLLSSVILAGLAPSVTRAADSWEAPFDSFDSFGITSRLAGEALTFGDVLHLVAEESPTLRAIALWQEGSAGRLKQAGLGSNPELGVEIEDVGWDAPGLKESEITISLAQEFEFFGQRGARREVARAENDATALQAKLSAFDLYLLAKQKFCVLVHAQKHLDLSGTSVELAGTIVENIRLRIDKGAGLQSELLLAQLEEQRAQLTQEQAVQEVSAAQVNLAALWNDPSTDIRVDADFEPLFPDLLDKVVAVGTEIDSSRGLLQLDRQLEVLGAEHSLAAAEARPTLTLSGGYKRLEADNSNSLLFGVSLPLPFRNRNQGQRETLQAQMRSLDYEINRARLETSADIRVNILKLQQLMQRHSTLDSLLLPTAEEAYRTLQNAYEAGRIPYTQLLEAERSLNELRFEHNDMLLEICEQFIAWESLTGVTLPAGKEN